MILRPKSLSRHAGSLPQATAGTPAALVPAWLRRAVADAQGPAGKRLEDIALVAGAAIGALDAVVRRQERWAAAWRQRLTLSAAAVTAKQAGRVEGEAALRDTVLLTRPGDSLSVGPAGLLLLAWRRLAVRPIIVPQQAARVDTLFSVGELAASLRNLPESVVCPVNNGIFQAAD